MSKSLTCALIESWIVNGTLDFASISPLEYLKNQNDIYILSYFIYAYLCPNFLSTKGLTVEMNITKLIIPTRTKNTLMFIFCNK